MSNEAPDELVEIASSIYTGENETRTLRALLGMFGQARRGSIVNRRIASTLADLNLRTEPDFRSVYIDDELGFRPAVEAEDGEAPAEIGDDAATEPTDYVGHDTTRDGSLYQVQRFITEEKMGRGLKSISRDESVKRAVTMMLTDDYSQLPVMQNEYGVEGIVSWQTIGKAFGLNNEPAYVRDCMRPSGGIVKDEDSIFKLIERVQENEVAFVESQNGKIITLFTAADLGDLYKDLSEPFMYLGEIENAVRALLERGQFTADELSVYRGDEGDEAVERMDDLAFGGYVRIMEDPDNWERLGLAVHHSTFTQRLDEIRIIRNAVMHFDPDGLTPDQVEKLERFGKFLRTLRR